MSDILIIDPIFTRLLQRNSDMEWFGPGQQLVFPKTYTVEEVLPLLAEAEAIVTCFKPVTLEMMRAAPALKVIAKPGAGFDNIDVPAATNRGVIVCNALGIRGAAVAEHVFFMMLYLARRTWLRGNPAWAATPLIELREKTIGIVGLGNIGCHVARIAAGFGMKIHVYTRTRDASRVPDIHLTFESLESLLPVVDFLVLCMPLTDETRGLFGSKTLALMKPSSILINVARGEAVLTNDLMKAIETGAIAGAGLDVTDPEPLPEDHPLRKFPNVLITPHHASRTFETDRAALSRTAENVLKALKGERPVNIVNPAVLSKKGDE